MYAGRIVEDAPTDTLFDAPRHPYTQGLLGALPPARRAAARAWRAIPGVVPEPAEPAARLRLRAALRAGDRAACDAAAPPSRRIAHASRAACIRAGSSARMIGIAARSRRLVACVTTQRPRAAPACSAAARDAARRRRRVVRAAARAHARPGRRIGLRQVDDRRSWCSGWCRSDARRGAVRRRGDAGRRARQAWRALRRRMQMVYQDPLGALDRRLASAAQIDGAAGDPRPRQRRPSGASKALRDAATRSGCAAHHFDRYPHELSGGQRQRIVLARALILDPAAPGLRRADLGARRLDPGAGGQPAARPAGSSSGSPICSSATTCAWSGRSATRSP